MGRRLGCEIVTISSGSEHNQQVILFLVQFFFKKTTCNETIYCKLQKIELHAQESLEPFFGVPHQKKRGKKYIPETRDAPLSSGHRRPVVVRYYGSASGVGRHRHRVVSKIKIKK